ncbi:hypothetical protein [Aestuariivita sp.]|jgi:hypothetical protein|uniref:hypothetical protein n=1 Tax=Aestuariivita sp. TaxID=1872407 RepID=UPI00216BFE24|nr:hypothetical protein [Aestuariivita sp.]MCE8009386.1 hypothetical protein [Aestuariivita sp.]
MADKKLTGLELDALFEAASQSRPVADEAWLGRVAQDAESEIRRRAGRRPPSFWQQISGVLGGWQGLGGMAVACGAGLWIGIAPPASLSDQVAVVLNTSSTVEILSETAFDYAMVLDGG